LIFLAFLEPQRRIKSTRDHTALLLDVGANTGSFCLLAALLPGLAVEAFEPLPSAIEVIDSCHWNGTVTAL